MKTLFEQIADLPAGSQPEDYEIVGDVIFGCGQRAVNLLNDGHEIEKKPPPTLTHTY